MIYTVLWKISWENFSRKNRNPDIGEYKYSNLINLMEKKKDPWIGALLNFFIWGLGYLYTGKRKVFGWMLLAVSILGFIYAFTAPWTLVGILESIILSIAFAYDAYKEETS